MPDVLATPAEDYMAGMHEVLRTLAALRDIARAQQDAARPDAAADLSDLVRERRLIEERLGALELSLVPLRTAAASPGADSSARRADIDEAHATARSIISAILACDQATLVLLDASVATRHARVQQLDSGEATLSAYRRSLAPTPQTKELIDRVY